MPFVVGFQTASICVASSCHRLPPVKSLTKDFFEEVMIGKQCSRRHMFDLFGLIDVGIIFLGSESEEGLESVIDSESGEESSFR